MMAYAGNATHLFPHEANAAGNRPLSTWILNDRRLLAALPNVGNIAHRIERHQPPTLCR